jgi:hypothetical protein
MIVRITTSNLQASQEARIFLSPAKLAALLRKTELVKTVSKQQERKATVTLNLPHTKAGTRKDYKVHTIEFEHSGQKRRWHAARGFINSEHIRVNG